MKAFVTCRGKAEVFGKTIEKDDVFTTDKHAFLSESHYGISTNNEFSAKLIRDSKVFVVNFLDKDIDLSNSGQYIDKFEESGIVKEEAESVDCPRIAGSEFLECEVVEEISLGSHVLFVGKIRNKK
ncbi:hypothetical protein D6745_04160 [Candidatus Woesearchaeota archaeon]|nr:MAG: hypothetical protein D6745_04160 [Candidatus Woesearchaeota archaeon]